MGVYRSGDGDVTMHHLGRNWALELGVVSRKKVFVVPYCGADSSFACRSETLNFQAFLSFFQAFGLPLTVSHSSTHLRGIPLHTRTNFLLQWPAKTYISHRQPCNRAATLDDAALDFMLARDGTTAQRQAAPESRVLQASIAAAAAQF